MCASNQQRNQSKHYLVIQFASFSSLLQQQQQLDPQSLQLFGRLQMQVMQKVG
uniref:Uncharacterized protein n=1 Tax=Rhizophora mucronata TaxID=61149 RepID=A0A2P2QXZ5_RHIMU